MNEKPKFNPLIPKDLFALMQNIQKLATDGYTDAISGVIAKEKVLNLATKFDSLYSCGESRMHKYRNKKKGISSCQLILFPCTNKLDFYWYLLITPDRTSDKSSKIHNEQNPTSILNKSDRITVQDKFELVRYTNPRSKELSWTWQMTKDQFESVSLYMDKSAKHLETAKYVYALNMLVAMPGFHGMRKQTETILQNIKNVTIHRNIEIPKHITMQFKEIYDGKRLSDYVTE